MAGRQTEPSPAGRSGDDLDERAALEADIKRLIVEVARLADVRSEDIGADASLLEEIGLDSLDLLQIAGALGKRYALRLGASNELGVQLASVSKIADLIGATRARGARR
jgi:acyl carrier protein